MTSIKIAIVDDDADVLKELGDLIAAFESTGSCLIDTFLNGADLVGVLEGTQYDLVLLDIEMPLDGMATAKEIRNTYDEHITKIIFVSSHDGYHRRLYEYKPLGFLDKPVKQGEFNEVFRRFLQEYDWEYRKGDVFEYSVANVHYRVLQRDILYFESEKRKMKIVLADREDIFYSTVGKLLEDLNAENFIQVHESFIINLDQVHGFMPNKFVMRNGAEISVGKSRALPVKAAMRRYLERGN